MSHVLSVFADNAIIYAPEHSRVTVAGRQLENEYQLSVHDEGTAIPARYHSDIFERFYRIDESRSSQNTQGTGLGLSIARAVADRHGYRISLSSAPKQGNTFILHIPTT
jgi:signal transduction histidine kinase